MSTPVQPNRSTLIFSENFESLSDQLQPFVSPSEKGGDGTDWTATPPNGWTVVNETPGGGPAEFHGWTFLDRNSWAVTADDQQRSTFANGQGVVAVADPDEYYDLENPGYMVFNSTLLSPEIDISDRAAGTVYLSFDSSWRPEGEQQGIVTVRFDGGDPIVLSNWLSDESQAGYKDHSTNETVILALQNPEGAQTAQIGFQLTNADNNWWWAVDNIAVTEGQPIDERNAVEFDAWDAQGGLLVRPELDANLTSFTLVWDLNIDVAQDQTFGGLFQSDAANGSDAELFLRSEGDGTYSLGISGLYQGSVPASTWTRVAITAEDQGGGQTRLSKYIDGVLVGTQNIATSRYTISKDNGFLLMADNDGETLVGKLAGFALVDKALAAGDIAALGNSAGGGIFAAAPEGAELVQFDFAASQMVDGTAAATTGNATITAQVPGGGIGDIDPATVLSFTNTGAAGGFEVDPRADADMTSFTLIWDVILPTAQKSGFGALFQSDLTNGDDADFFIRALGGGNFGIGINAQYEGQMKAGQWTRIALSVTDLGNGQSRLDKYLDGELVGTQTMPTSRYVIHKDGGFLMMADNDGETMDGFMAHMAVLDAALDADAIRALGGVSDAQPTLPEGVNADVFHFGMSNLSDGRAHAVVGDGVLTDRVVAAEERVQLDQEILHHLMKVGEQLVIDLDPVFTAKSDLTYSLTSSDGTPVDARIEDGKLIADAKGLGFSDFTLTATDAEGHTATDSFRLRVAGDNAYMIAALPDTQDYSGGSEIIGKMTAFLAANKDSLNLQHVLHVGDVTGSNTIGQWRHISDAYEALDAVGLQYSLLPGNHDQASGGSAANHSSNIGAFFGPDRYFAGATGPHGVYDGEPGQTMNNFKTFTAPDGTKWIVLSLEFGPRDDVLRWADEVLGEYADHRAILATHHYTNMADIAGPNSGPLYAEGTGKNYTMRFQPDGVNDGRDMWDTLLSKHGNVSMMFSGHVFGDGAETQVRYGEQGNPVFQIFVNYQNGVARVAQTAGDPNLPGNGGNGAMRLIVVDPDNKTMSTETYYANLDRFMTGSRGDAEPSRDGSGSYGGTTAPAPVQQLSYDTTQGLGLPEIAEGIATTVAALPHFDAANGLKVMPNSTSGATGAFADHTMVMDVYIPSQIGLVSILQTDLNNVNDGDMWIQQDGAGMGKIGTDGQDDGPFPVGGWVRIALVYDAVDGAPGTWQVSKYANGVLMGTQTITGDPAIAKRDGFLLFADDSGETPNGWAISSFGFTERALSADEVDALGGVTASGPFDAATAGPGGFQFSFGGDLSADFGRAEMTLGAGGSSDLSLTGSYRGHQEIFHDVDLGTVDAQFRAVAGQDVKVDVAATPTITLDGSASVDKLGRIAHAEWLDEHGVVVATGLNAQIDVAGGVHAYTLRVTDPEGRVSTDRMKVVGIDAATLVFDNFNDGNLDGWTAALGNWQAAGAIHSGQKTTEAGYLRSTSGEARGVILRDDLDEQSRNYTVTAQIENEGDAAMGLVAYASSADTMYRLEFNVAAHLIQLVRLDGGTRTVLAEQRDGAPFDLVYTAKLSVGDGGRLVAAIDGQTLFGGTVIDADPLTGGSAGFFHEGTSPLARLDDFSVRQGTLIADAGANRRIIDWDNDGKVSVDLSNATGSHQGGAVWSLDSVELAQGDTATVELGIGRHLVQLDQAVDDQTGRDVAEIDVVALRDLLAYDDFSDGTGNWTFVDRGELGVPAHWEIQDGALIQTENRYSRQLMGSGDTAPNSWWGLSWSPLGDGYHALRLGTYALYDDPASANWTDYSIEFDFTAPSGGAVGVLFHYVDENNYYKLELDRMGGYSQMTSVVDGIEQLEWQARPAYDMTGSNHLRLDIDGGKISAWLDGQLIFNPVEIHKVEKGGFGLYNWGAPGTTYDNVQVISLVEEIMVNGTAGIDFMKGTAASETFVLSGGNDLVTTGDGADVILFLAHDNGRRDMVTVTDFDVTADRIDLNGASVQDIRALGNDLLIRIAGEGDILRLQGVSDADQIIFI